MRFDYLDDDRRFDSTLFEYVYALKDTKSEREWWRISFPVEHEYLLKWLNFLETKGITKPKKAIEITDDIKRTCNDNPDKIENIFINERNNLTIYGGLDYLYNVSWIINNRLDRLSLITRVGLEEIFRYNRGIEYFEYLKATYEVSGIAIEEIEKEFTSAYRLVMGQ